MDTSPLPPQKKGLSGLAWLGLGCGALIVILILGAAGVGFFFGPKFMKFANEAQQNPTRATASVMLATGQFEMAAEDDVNKRYTVRQKAGGQLVTIYWDAKQGKPATVPGDFSAIPKDASPPATPILN
jgi:hypothetical protein